MISSPVILTVIPARGGSKGIPRKNLQLINGKPLVAYSIEQAKYLPSINRVVVSTDDREIASVSEHYGAEIVLRPEEISGDDSTSEEALLHVLQTLADREDYHPDLLVFLQCTSPLTLPVDIQGTIDVLLEKQADTAFAVIPFHYFLWDETEDGFARAVNHRKEVRLMRQEREPQYLETGAVYVMRVEGFLEARHCFFGKTVMYVIPPERRLEINEPVDLLNAELLIKEQNYRI